MHRLSKSRFIEGLQCPKRLYLSTHHRDEGLARYSRSDFAMFEAGTEVGVMATRLFPGGVRVEADYDRPEEALARTRALLADPQVSTIFEAAFVYNQVLVRVDILERVSHDAWRIVEVKSSTGVKDSHYPDAAIQCYVARGAGLAVPSAHLLLINNQYVYDGIRLDLDQLFFRKDIAGEVEAWQDRLPTLLAGQFEVLAGELPIVEPGPHCNDGYGCPYWDHCTANKPRYWVKYLYDIRARLYEGLIARGVETIDEIPDDVPLSAVQRRIRDCVRSGAPYVGPGLQEAVRIERYPAHYLDFETINPAVPLYAGTRPFQQIPFQWSVRTLPAEDADPIEHAYLSQDGLDPRRELAVKLLQVLQGSGPVYVYHRALESVVLKELAASLPDLSEGLSAIEARVVDLLPLVRNHYFHPDMVGSFSLKSVTPALLPELGYGQLAIQGGMEAGPAYLMMVSSDCSPEERERIRRDLLAYCGHDTLALLRVHRTLLRLAG